MRGKKEEFFNHGNYGNRFAICAEVRGIWEGKREGARGAAKEVTREIKRLC